ncbi:helix-turn-helix transcriptional regulator [Paenibacillus wenxiniae]|uniref:Helix-turn-helix transcriptional regulator n=1 Tax=Paenibacillus wenxiniae TaxID=1636843 RepID=A0ABW4RCV3_9BACL
MGIKENIKILRDRYDLTQQELAEIAGVGNKAVSAWENGLSEPRMGAIERMAAHFNIKKSNLIEEGGLEIADNAESEFDEALEGFLVKYGFDLSEIKDIAAYIEYVKSKR